MYLPPETRSSLPKKDFRTNPHAAETVAPHAKTAAADRMDAAGKCILLFVPRAAGKPRCHSNQAEKNRYIAANAFQKEDKSANTPLSNRHISQKMCFCFIQVHFEAAMN